jgi:hypothetical protein
LGLRLPARWRAINEISKICERRDPLHTRHALHGPAFVVLERNTIDHSEPRVYEDLFDVLLASASNANAAKTKITRDSVRREPSKTHTKRSPTMTSKEATLGRRNRASEAPDNQLLEAPIPSLARTSRVVFGRVAGRQLPNPLCAFAPFCEYRNVSHPSCRRWLHKSLRTQSDEANYRARRRAGIAFRTVWRANGAH